MLAFLGAALQQSKIQASPELVGASTKYVVDHDAGGTLRADIDTAFVGLLEASGGDPFTAVGMLIESSHAMSAETRAALAGALALADAPKARCIAVLFLLDPVQSVRRAAAGALAQVAASLEPIDVRRLIAMRNWRPESERAEVDAVIRNARGGAIECAQWEAGSIETIIATAIDGATAQGFVLLSPTGRKKQLSLILTKAGIAEAWSGEPVSRRQLEANLVAAGLDAPKLAVSRQYLDSVVAQHLALTLEKGQASPFGLLQVAETIGGAEWQPARVNFGETLAGLIAEVPREMCEGPALVSLLRDSGELADLEAVARSWFEDDPDLVQAVERARCRDRAKLATYLLQTVIARRRDRWAEVFLRTALWMREAPPEADLCWRELVIVAKALADGRDLTEIGLMRDIAARTLAVLKATGRI
jgi:hypothetical protein